MTFLDQHLKSKIIFVTLRKNLFKKTIPHKSSCEKVFTFKMFIIYYHLCELTHRVNLHGNVTALLVGR
jgi:hypothetical protein